MGEALALAIFFGNKNVAWTSQSQHSLVAIDCEPLLTILKDDKDIKIKILKLYNAEGKLMARIENNRFWISPLARKERPDRSTLRIFSDRDEGNSNEKILELRYLNQNSLYVEGRFTRNAKSLDLLSKDNDFSSVCLGNSPAADFHLANGQLVIGARRLECK